MEIRIYSNTGELRLAAAPSQSDRETAGIGQDSVLSLSLTAFECVALEVYDYVDFLGRRYILTDAYLPRMVARSEWKYDLKLYGVEALAAHTLMVNPTDGDDNPEVTLTAPAAEHAALIVANLNRRAGTTLWQVGTVIDTPYIDLDYTGMTASDAIAALASAAGSEWWFDGYTFNLCRCEYGDAIQLEYGGMLLSEITPGIADGATFFTRLFPLGSTRNIDPDKYGHARLQLPDGSRYVDSRTDLGIIEAFEEDAFAGIYPRRVGQVGEVRSEQRTGEDGVDYTVWYFTDPDLPFNPNDYEIGGLVKKVTFQSGELRGRVFEVNYDTAGKEFEIITQWPYENDVQLPTPPLIPATGDEYVLWNISMPESYYPAAEEEYRKAVDEFIADKQREVTQFSAPTDCTVVGSAAAELRPGRRVRIVSAEYFPETGYRETRIISVSRSVENPASMTLTMGDVLSSGRLQRIENGLSEISGATSRIETNLSSSSQSLQRKLDRSVFYDLFEKVNIGTASEPKYAIRAKYSFYTDGFLSAMGLNPGMGGGEDGGATALSELNDVRLEVPTLGDVLIYDGTHWINRPQSSIAPDLSAYATRVWVQQQGYATAAALSNKVDKIEGYGLTKNDFTDALLSKLNGIEAGANRYIHPTGGADASIADAAGRVLAGITVNALGHVTSVASKTLAEADIPTLAISKVSGLQDALDGKLDAATFDDLFEKVNIGTTSEPKYAIRAKYGLFSDSFLSAMGLNPGMGGGEGGGSYDRLDAWADYTAERAGWVLSAALGYDLHNRVRSLEGGSALSFTTEGSGNVVTAVKKSGTSVTVTKGLTALTSHQPIYALTFQAGAFEAKKYTPNTGVATVNIPTKTSHLSNDSGFATKLGVSGNQIGTYVDGKLGNLITVPYATNADTVDGYHETSFFRDMRAGAIPEADLATFVSRNSGTYRINMGGYSDGMAVFKTPLCSASALELRYRYMGKLWARFSADANRYYTDWKEIAFTDSNVASATKLQTARSLWGQSFDGTKDISGNMTGVGTISASGNITVEKSGSNPTKIIVKNGNGTISIDNTTNRGLYDDSTARWLIGTSGNNTFLMGGYVGIGTMSAGYELDVVGTIRAREGLVVPYTGNTWITMATRKNIIRSTSNNTTTNAHALYRVKDSNGNAIVFGGLGGDVGFYGFSAENISAGTNSRTWWTTWNVATGDLLTTGNIEIKKSAAQIKVNNGSTTISLHNDGNRGLYDNTTTRWLIGTNGTNTFLLGGKIGVGTQTPAYNFDVVGVIRATAGIFSDAYMSAKGINTASDMRLKRRREDVALTVKDVAEAPVYRFAWINGGGIDVGSTAQYWAARVPELTHLLADGIHLGLDYGKAALLSVVSVARATADHERRIADIERQLQNRTI